MSKLFKRLAMALAVAGLLWFWIQYQLPTNIWFARGYEIRKTGEFDEPLCFQLNPEWLGADTLDIKPMTLLLNKDNTCIYLETIIKKSGQLNVTLLIKPKYHILGGTVLSNRPSVGRQNPVGIDEFQFFSAGSNFYVNYGTSMGNWGGHVERLGFVAALDQFPETNEPINVQFNHTLYMYSYRFMPF